MILFGCGWSKAGSVSGPAEMPLDEPHASVLCIGPFKNGGTFFGAVHRRLSRFHVRRRDGNLQIFGRRSAGEVGTRQQTARVGRDQRSTYIQAVKKRKKKKNKERKNSNKAN